MRSTDHNKDSPFHWVTFEDYDKRNCDDGPKHRPGSGEKHRGERGTGKSRQCPEFEYSCV